MHRTSSRPAAPAAPVVAAENAAAPKGSASSPARAPPGPYEIETPRRDGRLDPVPARINVPPLLSHWTPAPLLAGYTTGAQDRVGEFVTAPNA
ncbi:hypothetical protein [Brachybacterium sp. GPGPB12]|uniref:hypothetical protein n=1 Tax=Brachybacterium sp. GPGPB12 TaxID=3023517 RepID=UPI003134267A